MQGVTSVFTLLTLIGWRDSRSMVSSMWERVFPGSQFFPSLGFFLCEVCFSHSLHDQFENSGSLSPQRQYAGDSLRTSACPSYSKPRGGICQAVRCLTHSICPSLSPPAIIRSVIFFIPTSIFSLSRLFYSSLHLVSRLPCRCFFFFCNRFCDLRSAAGSRDERQTVGSPLAAWSEYVTTIFGDGLSTRSIKPSLLYLVCAIKIASVRDFSFHHGPVRCMPSQTIGSSRPVCLRVWVCRCTPRCYVYLHHR